MADPGGDGGRDGRTDRRRLAIALAGAVLAIIVLIAAWYAYRANDGGVTVTETIVSPAGAGGGASATPVRR